MMPSIFKADASNFNSLGIGRLTRAVSCNVVEEINGAYELNMTLLADDPFVEYVQIGNIIAVKPNMVDTVQAFVIEEIKRNINGEIEIYAPHIAQHRTKLLPVRPINGNSLNSVIMALNDSTMIIEQNPFTISTDMESWTHYSMQFPKTYRDIMGGTEGSILDVYGGEYVYDNFSILLTSKRGKDADARVVYGRNMTSYDQNDLFDWDRSVTGVLPYWYEEGSASVIGDIQYSQYADLYPYKKAIVMDLTEKFEEQPTKADLNAWASTWVNSKGLPSMTIEAGFDQYDLTDADVNTIQLGDTVTVINSMYNVNYQSRVMSYDFNVLAETYNSLTVGAKKLTIAEVIAQTAKVTIKKSGLNVSQESTGTLVVG